MTKVRNAIAGGMLATLALIGCTDNPTGIGEGSAPQVVEAVLGKTTIGGDTTASLLALFLTHSDAEGDALETRVRLLNTQGAEIAARVTRVEQGINPRELQFLALQAGAAQKVEAVLEDVRANHTTQTMEVATHPRAGSPQVGMVAAPMVTADSVFLKFSVNDAEHDGTFVWIFGLTDTGEWAFFRRMIVPRVDFSGYHAQAGFRQAGVEKTKTFYVLMADRAGNLSSAETYTP